MKILIVLPNNSHGGAEQYLKMVGSQFKEKDLTIVFLKKGDSHFWDELKEHSTQKHYSVKSELKGFIKFAFNHLFGRSKSYDLVFTSHVYVNGLMGFLMRLNRIKANQFIARESTSIFLRYKGFGRLLYQMMYRFGYQKINLLICQTELMKDQLIKHLPYLEKRMHIKVIPNPIDLDAITKSAKEQLSLPTESPYIVSAGRLITEKGFDILINAFNKIKKEHHSLKLVILGEGKLKEDLIHLVKELHLDDDVIFEGHVHNVYPYFKHAKLCVVSSRIEGFPNVLLQMMSQNNSVVSTLCAGGIESIPGIITAPSNHECALKDAIIESLNRTNSGDNRTLFDDYLKSRDVKQFIKSITTS